MLEYVFRAACRFLRLDENSRPRVFNRGECYTCGRQRATSRLQTHHAPVINCSDTFVPNYIPVCACQCGSRSKNILLHSSLCSSLSLYGSLKNVTLTACKLNLSQKRVAFKSSSSLHMHIKPGIYKTGFQDSGMVKLYLYMIYCSGTSAGRFCFHFFTSVLTK